MLEGIIRKPASRTADVQNSFACKIYVEQLGHGRQLLDVTKKRAGKKGLPDGLKVDREGNLWETGPGGVLVISPDGKHLGSIETGVPTGNLAWGEDGSSLFITSNTNVYRLKLTTRGAGW